MASLRDDGYVDDEGTTAGTGRGRGELARARAELAAARAQEAALRAKEIRSQIRARRGSRGADVLAAAERADVARQRAEEALTLVAASRESSACRHDLAAEAHERAATAGAGDIALHLTKALAHRLAAQDDRDLNKTSIDATDPLTI